MNKVYILISILLASCSSVPKESKTSNEQTSSPNSSIANNVTNTSKRLKGLNRSDEVKPLIRKAQKLALDGLYRESLKVCEEVLKHDEINREAHRMIGVISVKTGDYNRSISHLELISDQLDQDFEANFYLAEAYRAKDRYADAIFRYKLALFQKPNHLIAQKALAWSYYKIRYYKASLKTAIQTWKSSPNDVQANIILARVLDKMGKHQKALLRLKKLMLKCPEDKKPYIYSVLGDIYSSMGNFAKAESSYKEALQGQPLLAGALLGLGKILLNKGDNINSAITYLERATRIKPNLIETLFFLGKAQRQYHPSLSERYLKRFKRLASGDPEYREYLRETKELLHESTPRKHGVSKSDKFLDFPM